MTPYAFRHPIKRAAAALLDGVGGALLRPRRTAGFAPKNLLIIRLDHLGDVWNITGLPKAAKEHFAACRVTCLVSSAAAPLLEANPFVDEIICFDAPWFWNKKRGGSLQGLARDLSRRKFDTALSLRGDLREHWLVFRAGIPRRIGTGITGGGFFLTDRVDWRADAHESERLSDAAEILGLPKKAWPPEIYFKGGEKERLIGEAEAKGLVRGRRFVGLQIDAGSAAKRWPARYASELMRQVLSTNPAVSFALLGTDTACAREAVRGAGPALEARVTDLSGRLSLREWAACSGRLELLVAPDSGPAHMLSWLGVPTLFLYSGTNRLESWRPRAEGAAVFHHPVSCAPCGLRVCRVKGHPCMEGIEPGRAAAWVLERLR